MMELTFLNNKTKQRAKISTLSTLVIIPRNKTILKIKYRYISTLFIILDAHLKSQNHCVSILQSIKLQLITKKNN